jgi:endoglucanase
MRHRIFWPRVLAIGFVLALSVRAAPAVEQARNPFQGKKLFVDPFSPARKQAAAWQKSRPQDAARMMRIAQTPQVIWLGSWHRDVRRDVDDWVTRITKAGALPVFAIYNIPHRDCGSHSSGGARDGDAYRRYMIDIARGLERRPSVIILEPDAIAGADCLPLRLKDERFVLLQESIKILNAAGASVYIDAGHANWKPPEDIAQRLRKAGIDVGTGFALNVSNFHSTATNVSYGNRVSALIGGKHYVIDTSRNGAGTAGNEWCNARNQALGAAPTTDTRVPLVDAFLWVKVPGESDGQCNGGPKSGAWWAEYALELTKAAEVLAGR